MRIPPVLRLTPEDRQRIRALIARADARVREEMKKEAGDPYRPGGWRERGRNAAKNYRSKALVLVLSLVALALLSAARVEAQACPLIDGTQYPYGQCVNCRNCVGPITNCGATSAGGCSCVNPSSCNVTCATSGGEYLICPVTPGYCDPSPLAICSGCDPIGNRCKLRTTCVDAVADILVDAHTCYIGQTGLVNPLLCSCTTKAITNILTVAEKERYADAKNFCQNGIGWAVMVAGHSFPLIWMYVNMSAIRSTCALLYDVLINDPADPNFQVLATTTGYYSPTRWASPSLDPVTSAQAGQLNKWVLAEISVLDALRCAVDSLNRYQGAMAAGSYGWALHQRAQMQVCVDALQPALSNLATQLPVLSGPVFKATQGHPDYRPWFSGVPCPVPGACTGVVFPTDTTQIQTLVDISVSDMDIP